MMQKAVGVISCWCFFLCNDRLIANVGPYICIYGYMCWPVNASLYRGTYLMTLKKLRVLKQTFLTTNDARWPTRIHYSWCRILIWNCMYSLHKILWWFFSFMNLHKNFLIGHQKMWYVIRKYDDIHTHDQCHKKMYTHPTVHKKNNSIGKKS